MNTTPNFNLPKPINTADVDEEFYRLQLAWDMLDLILFSLAQQITGKSNLGHSHTIADIVGLATALANKMDATRSFSLDDLADVDGAAEAATTYLLVKGADGRWMPSSAIAALGAHQHALADIAGLTDALTALIDAIGLKANSSDVYTRTDIDNLIWTFRCGVGQHYFVDTSKAGADMPPSGTAGPVFIELTAGLTGAGAFNNGKLTSESVSGSAPLVLATAVVSVAGSPMNGKTIDLINTESRIIRPSTSPGTKQDDAIQGHQHQYLRVQNAGSGLTGGSGFSSFTDTSTNPVSDGVNGTPRTANETRMKNIGVKAYMRVK